MSIWDYVFQVEDFHGRRLRFHLYPSLYTETGMPVQRLKRLVASKDGLFVLVRCCGLPQAEDTLGRLKKIQKVVHQLMKKVFPC